MAKCLFVFMLVVILVLPATADIIYDPGDPVNAGGISGAYGIVQLDNFTLAPGANVITRIEWFGGYRWFNP